MTAEVTRYTAEMKNKSIHATPAYIYTNNPTWNTLTAGSSTGSHTVATYCSAKSIANP